jgi:hypothetical protein
MPPTAKQADRQASRELRREEVVKRKPPEDRRLSGGPAGFITTPWERR